jgi:hypothetical protein
MGLQLVIIIILVLPLFNIIHLFESRHILDRFIGQLFRFLIIISYISLIIVNEYFDQNDSTKVYFYS